MWHNDDFKVKDVNQVKGLFSKRKFKTGEVVCLIEGEEIDKPNRYSVQVSSNKHINVREPAMYINHDCFANIKLFESSFIAIKDIAIDEEIVFNYLATEDVLAEPFECFKCGQKVFGKKHAEKHPCILLTTETP